MKFRLLWIGKTKDENWRALQEEYLQRLSFFVRCEIVEIKDSSREIESKRILESVNQSPFICLLDVKGRSISSAELAKNIENWQNRGFREITFIIGGATGVTAEVVEKADYSLSLSVLTLTHEMARVVLLEQLYRAFTITKGFPYHNE